MTEPGPCVVCGARDYPLSMGGTTICPACDCGIPPGPRLREMLEHVEGERNHAFAFLRLILDAPYEPLPPSVLDAMRELVENEGPHCDANGICS